MRGDTVSRIYGLHEGREKQYFFGAYRSRAEAEAEVAKLCAKEMDGRNWAEQYHNRGFVIREERFGYVELATFGFVSPCLTPAPLPGRNSAPLHFIEVSKYDGVTQVSFAVPLKFSLESGRPEEWERRRVANLE